MQEGIHYLQALTLVLKLGLACFWQVLIEVNEIGLRMTSLMTLTCSPTLTKVTFFEVLFVPILNTGSSTTSLPPFPPARLSCSLI